VKTWPSGARYVLVTALIVGWGCRTPTVDRVPDELEMRAMAYVAAQIERGDRVTSLRARARTEIDGAAGDAFSRQLLLLEQPARLRIEVLGLLGQRAMVLATDGQAYEIYRAGAPQMEQGTVHAGVLWEAAGVPLAPDAAVAILLAAPEPDTAGQPKVEWDGANGHAVVAYSDQTFGFDTAGHLRTYRWHPEGHDWVVARYDDWQDEGVAFFPRRFALDFPANGARAEIQLQEVELNPALADEVFRLRPAKPLSSALEGEGG
jgi:hypothetical protein